MIPALEELRAVAETSDKKGDHDRATLSWKQIHTLARGLYGHKDPRAWAAISRAAFLSLNDPGKRAHPLIEAFMAGEGFKIVDWRGAFAETKPEEAKRLIGAEDGLVQRTLQEAVSIGVPINLYGWDEAGRTRSLSFDGEDGWEGCALRPPADLKDVEDGDGGGRPVGAAGVAGLVRKGWRLMREMECPRAAGIFRRALGAMAGGGGHDGPETEPALTGLGAALFRMADYAGALPVFRRLLKVREGAFGAGSRETLLAKSAVGWTMFQSGDRAGALEPLREAREGLEALLGPRRGDVHMAKVRYARALAGDWRREVSGPVPPADALEAVALFRELVETGAFPDSDVDPISEDGPVDAEDASYRDFVTRTMLADTLFAVGDRKGAMAVRAESLDIATGKKVGDLIPIAKMDLGLSLLSASRGDGASESRPGELRKRALRLLKEASDAVNEHDGSASDQIDVAASLAEAECCCGMTLQAFRRFMRVVAVIESGHGPDALDAACVRVRAARALESEMPEAAAVLLAGAAASLLRVQGAEDPGFPELMRLLGEVCRRTGDAREAIARLCFADDDISGPAGGMPASPRVHAAIEGLKAEAMLGAREGPAAAAGELARALSLKAAAFGPEHPETARAMGLLAEAKEAAGDPVEAHGLAEKALEVWEKSLGTASDGAKKARLELARLAAVIG
jgi:tetratricopeptide (TPR) repeat protein